MGRRVCLSGVVLALLLGSTAVSAGQVGQAARPPATRPGAEEGATGIPFGAFRLVPSLTLATTFDDNIKRTDTGALSDTIFTVSPALALRSQWAQHSLNLNASFDALMYAKYSSENITPYNLGANGRLDVLRSLRVLSQVSFAQLYELRSSPELPINAAKPLPYKRTQGDVTVEYQPALVGFQLGIGFEHVRYDSLETVAGLDVSWTDQDRDVFSPHARVFYEFLPGYQAYVETVYETRDFELSLDRFGFDRSSHGYRVRGGLNALLGNLLQGEIFVGYLNQTYKAPLEDVTGPDYGASLDWFVTPLTTIHLTGARTLTDTTFGGISALDNRGIALGVDHAFLRNLILRANVGYTDSQYTGGSRTDTLTNAGFGVDYFFSPRLSAAASYVYEQRTSNATAAGYSDNLIRIGITGRL